MMAAEISMNSPTCILVMRFGAAGDVVLMNGALSALARAWPHAKIVVATQEAFVDLVQYHPNVHAVEVLRPDDRFWTYLKRLRAYRFDAVLDLHGKIRSCLLVLLLGVARHVRWHKRTWALSVRVRLLHRPFRHPTRMALRYHQAVESLVGHVLPESPMQCFLAPHAQREAENLAAKLGLLITQTRWVGMSPGAMWLTKRWPADYFRALAVKLGEAGYSVLVFGSAREASMVREVTKGLACAYDASGVFSWAVLAGALSHSTCAAFVANDSGPMHLARALGVPTLAIFGSTDPHQFDFCGHHALFAGLSCSPCSFYGLSKCPKKHLACLKTLTPDKAWTALSGLLAKGRVPSVLG